MPPDLKREAIHFVEFFQSKVQKNTLRVSLKGIWADMDVNLTEEDIKDARKERWKILPREHFFEKNEDNERLIPTQEFGVLP